MTKINGLVALSIVSVALMGCGSGADTSNEAATEATTEPADGISDMMGGDNEERPNNLGTANGQDINDVDVKMNPDMHHSEEQMTGAEEIEEQRPEPQ